MTSFLLRIMTEVKKCFMEIIIDELKTGDSGFGKHWAGCTCHGEVQASQQCLRSLRSAPPTWPGCSRAPTPCHLTQTRGSWSQSFTAQNPGRCRDFLRHLSIPTQKGNTFLSTSLCSLPTGVPPVLFPVESLKTPTASPASWTPEGPVGGRAHKLTLWLSLGFYPKRKS